MRALLLLVLACLAQLSFSQPEVGYMQVVPTLMPDNSDTDCQAVAASTLGGDVSVDYYIWDMNASRSYPAYSGKAECTGESWGLGKPCHSGYFDPRNLSGVVTCRFEITDGDGIAGKSAFAARACIENCTDGCGDGACGENETALSCAQDCIGERLEIEPISPAWGTGFNRGDAIPIAVALRSQGAPATNATVAASGVFGEIRLYDDGRHGDGTFSDGVYAGTGAVPGNASGLGVIRLVAAKGREAAVAYVGINVPARLEIEGDAGGAHKLGDVIPVTGTISSNGKPASGEAVLELYPPSGKLAYSEKLRFADGKVMFSYHNTLEDELGNWTARLSASDEFGNSGLWKGAFILTQLAPGSYLEIEFLAPTIGTYVRGKAISITARVKRAGQPVSGAKVSFTSPGGDTIEMGEVQGGAYGATYTIMQGDKLGAWNIQIRASLSTESGSIEGSTSGGIVLAPSELDIKISRPDHSVFEVGENLEIVAIAKYPDGEIVNAKRALVSVSSDRIQMQRTADGVYVAYYPIAEGQAGEIVLSVDVEDGYGNTGSKSAMISVSGTSLQYTLDKNRMVLIPAAFALLAGAAVFVRTYVLHSGKQRLLKRKEELLKLQKDLQEGYLKEGTVDRKSFYELSAKYDSEMKKIDWELLEGEKHG